MTPDDIYAALALPERCRLGKRVFKKLFQKNVEMTAADKRALSEDVDGIVWQYTLKPTTLPVHPYEDETRAYLEIAVLETTLKESKRAVRLVELMHRAIPYPLLIVAACQNAVALSVAHKRFSLAEKSAVVAEPLLMTDWMASAEPEGDRAFLNSLALSGLPHTDFLALYSALAGRVLAQVCARMSGQFVLRPTETEEERRKKLDAALKLENEIASLKSTVKAESNFAAQVDLNVRIKELQQKLAEKAAAL